MPERSQLSHGALRSASTLAPAILFGFVLTVSTVASSRTLQVVHDFTGIDGRRPKIGLTIDAAGKLYGASFEGGSTNLGVVYRLSRAGSGWVLNTLYTFQGGPDGVGPMGRVVFGPDGALYGTTNQGGSTACGEPVGCGTVFKLQPPATFCKTPLCPWTKTILYTFGATPDGQFPVGDLTFDSAGNIYGVTTNGGQHNRGTVYELSRSNEGWTETILDSFGIIYNTPEAGVTFGSEGDLYGTLAYANGNPPCCYGAIYSLQRSGTSWTEHILYVLGTGGQNDGAYPYSGVVFDSVGNLYGATTIYGAQGGGTVFELLPSGGGWSYSVLYSLAGGIRGPGPYGTLMFDQFGSLYGATVAGGANMLGNVFKLSRSGGGWIYTSVYDFNDASVAGYPYSNVVFDVAGNLYGTFTLGGALGSCQQGCGGVLEITP